jgi:hypothetical protein
MQQQTYTLTRWVFFIGIVVIFHWSLSGCNKNSGLNHLKADSTDTMRIPVHHDSAKFDVDFLLQIANTSGVFPDSFGDYASMVIYVVDGVVKVPTDSIRNWPPIVSHESGSSGSWSATWIPDSIGEINVVGGSGFVYDTTVVMAILQSGTVSPKWAVSFMGQPPSDAGGDATPGWPLTFDFSLQQEDQFPLRLEQGGNMLVISVYKEY